MVQSLMYNRLGCHEQSSPVPELLGTSKSYRPTMGGKIPPTGGAAQRRVTLWEIVSCQFRMLSQGNNVSLGTEKIGTDKAGGRTSQRRGYTCTFKNFLT